VFPSAAAQLWFIRNYLSTLRVIPLTDVSTSEAHALYAETQCWLLAPHLFWLSWAIVQSRHSPIEFDYLSYAKQRWEGYRAMKEKAYQWLKRTPEEVEAITTME
jgi:ethanolamine kinase